MMRKGLFLLICFSMIFSVSPVEGNDVINGNFTTNVDNWTFFQPAAGYPSYYSGDPISGLYIWNDTVFDGGVLLLSSTPQRSYIYASQNITITKTNISFNFMEDGWIGDGGSNGISLILPNGTEILNINAETKNCNNPIICSFDADISDYNNSNVTVRLRQWTTYYGAGTSYFDNISTYDRTYAPIMISAVVSPAEPDDNDMLITSVSASDADGDDITYTYQWYENGNSLTGSTSSWLSKSYTSINNGYKIYVTPYDGTEYGEGLYSNTVTVSVPVCKENCGGGDGGGSEPTPTPGICPIFVIPICDVTERIVFYPDVDINGCQISPTCDLIDVPEVDEPPTVGITPEDCGDVCKLFRTFQGIFIGESMHSFSFEEKEGSVTDIYIQLWEVAPWKATVEFDKNISFVNKTNDAIVINVLQKKMTLTFGDIDVLSELYGTFGDKMKIVSNSNDEFMLEVSVMFLNLTWLKWIVALGIVIFLLKGYFKMR